MRVRSFKLFHHTVKVRYQKKIVDEAGDRLQGDALLEAMLLRVATTIPVTGLPYSPDMLEHNRCHEMVHLWLEAAGYAHLSRDERLVDTLAGFICQYESSVIRR